MRENAPLELPADLQARLDAAGVIDQASLMTALESDPVLRADFQAFIATHQEQLFQLVWQAFVNVSSLEELRELARQSPFVLEDQFVSTVEQEIERMRESGQSEAEKGLQQRLAGLQELRRRAAVNLSPLEQAVMDFVQAESDAEAQALFQTQRTLLLPELAQRTLEDRFRSDDPEIQQVLAGRIALLRELRTAAQAVDTSPHVDSAMKADTDQPAVDTHLANLLVAFLNTHDLTQMRRLLEHYPTLLSEAVEPVFGALFQQYAEDASALQTLQDRQSLLAACRTQGVERVFESLAHMGDRLAQVERFEQALNDFIDLRQTALSNPNDILSWQRAVDAGEALLVPPLSETPELNLEALQVEVAGTWNELGNALSAASEHAAALAAYERAVALQPEVGVWQRNRAGMLIALGCLDEATQSITAARKLEPDAPRLAELEAELAAARGMRGEGEDARTRGCDDATT